MAILPTPAMLAHWHQYVQAFVDLYASQGLKQDSASAPLCTVSDERPAQVVVCSPHPDDEVLNGLLPLRLMREAGAQVTNLAVTLGSNPLRRTARLEEMRRACALLGFAPLTVESPHGFDRITALSRGLDPTGWQRQVEVLASRFAELRPDLLLFPHAGDAHPTHIGTHYLALAAALLFSRASRSTFWVAETEFWHPHAASNLLVGAHADHLALLIAALCQHRGEISRNPYHLMLPARMTDTVRRCSERFKGAGAGEVPFLFGEAYAISRISDGVWQVPVQAGMVIPPIRPTTLIDLAALAGAVPGR